MTHSDFEIASITGSNKLGAFKPEMSTVPIYPSFKVRSSTELFSIYLPYQNNLWVYADGALQQLSLPPAFEPIVLGKKMDFKSPRMKLLYKDHPYVPTYRLIKNILLSEDNVLILQIQSYKKGEQVVFWDIEKEKITKTITSPPGKLIGRDSTFYYFYHDNAIKKYTAKEMEKCSNQQFTFYISSFEEQCQSCKTSFLNIYDWVRLHNIPYRFSVEDPNWFSSADKEDFREVVDYMTQWNVWGAVRFEDDCDDCFESGISVRVGKQGEIISLPAEIEKIQSRIPCVE
ncbi:hypothetical protein [Fodinibius halophilus]|uniref:Uncharacterized protein n=1 Tax=Fodinibius halophilus TaxID=1736908 RepID=A0A6M1TJ65_9BACT|nr:hypothetical protein [Fodinibius halophilus]NGP90092.1 hypothetical protein [Fodinibius halophilus]